MYLSQSLALQNLFSITISLGLCTTQLPHRRKREKKKWTTNSAQLWGFEIIGSRKQEQTVHAEEKSIIQAGSKLPSQINTENTMIDPTYQIFMDVKAEYEPGLEYVAL